MSSGPRDRDISIYLFNVFWQNVPFLNVKLNNFGLASHYLSGICHSIDNPECTLTTCFQNETNNALKKMVRDWHSTPISYTPTFFRRKIRMCCWCVGFVNPLTQCSPMKHQVLRGKSNPPQPAGAHPQPGREPCIGTGEFRRVKGWLFQCWDGPCTNRNLVSSWFACHYSVNLRSSH